MIKGFSISFPRKLNPNEEEYLISAFQETAFFPVKKELEKAAKGLGKFSFLKGMPDIMRSKVEVLATTVNSWMQLNSADHQTYTFSFDTLSSNMIGEFDVPGVGKMHVGNLVPEKKIIRFMKSEVFPHFGFKAGEVKVSAL